MRNIKKYLAGYMGLTHILTPHDRTRYIYQSTFRGFVVSFIDNSLICNAENVVVIVIHRPEQPLRIYASCGLFGCKGWYYCGTEDAIRLLVYMANMDEQARMALFLILDKRNMIKYTNDH